MMIKEDNVSLEDLNVLASDPKKFVLDCEEKFNNDIDKIIYTLNKNKDIRFVLITGPSASGKTTTAKLLKKRMTSRKSVVISMDDFFIDRDVTPILPNGRRDFENVKSVNAELFKKTMDNLLLNSEAYLPIYDFKLGKRIDNAKKLAIDKDTVIIIEGIHSFSDLTISEDMKGKDLKVYVCPLTDFTIDNKVVISSTKLRLLRRLNRDYNTRGISVDETLSRWQDVLDGEKVYIEPYKSKADLFLNSVHNYEPYLYSNELKSLIDTNKNAQEIFKNFALKSSVVKDLIPSDSLILEFLGKNVDF
jgi:uridine kinase